MLAGIADIDGLEFGTWEVPSPTSLANWAKAVYSEDMYSDLVEMWVDSNWMGLVIVLVVGNIGTAHNHIRLMVV